MGNLDTPLKGAMSIKRVALLLGLTVTMVSFNARTIAVAIGPVLPSLADELSMSPTVSGFLTALPTLCFALFGFLAPHLAQRVGLHRAILAALALNVAGQVWRNLSGDTVNFMLATVLALSGIGLINVLLPPLVKRHFPKRTGLATALYSTSQSIGLTMASLYTAPLAISLGSWRGAFWVWAATSAAAVPLMVWAMVRFAEGKVRRGHRISLRQVARTRLGWMMAIFFGMQSAQAYGQFGWLPTIYQEAGFTPIQAGQFLGIVAGLGIPFSFLIPQLTTRLKRPVILLALMSLCGMVGYAGLLIDPTLLPWLWPSLMAIAGSFFPMILVLLSVHTRSPVGTAALSSFAQSMGYVLAATGPFLFGALKDATGGFEWPLAIQLAMFIPLLITGTIAMRSGTLEDELGIDPDAGVNEAKG